MLTYQEAKSQDLAVLRLQNLKASLMERKILTLVVEAASSCNLKCTFCDAHSGRAPKFREHAGVMSEETWQEVFSQLATYVLARGKLKMLQFHGNGEPLLNKRLAKMIRQVKSQDLVDKVRIITNGILLDTKKAEELLDAGVDEIHISVDTLDREKYNHVKVGDYAPRVLDNMLSVIPVFEKHRTASLYIKYFEAEENNSYGIDAHDSETVLSTFVEYARDSEFVHLKQQPLVDVGKGMLDGKADLNAPCEIPFYLLYIMHNGKISACCSDVFNGLTVGHISDPEISSRPGRGASILSTVDSEALYSVREKHISGKCGDLKLCAGCGNRTAVDLSTIPDHEIAAMKQAISPDSLKEAV